MAEPTPLPIACTLTGASLEERVAWLRRLGKAALIRGVRQDDRLDMWFLPEAADDVRELVRAESECCPFLSFEIQTGDTEVTLAVTAPREAGAVLDALLGEMRASRAAV